MPAPIPHQAATVKATSAILARLPGIYGADIGRSFFCLISGQRKESYGVLAI